MRSISSPRAEENVRRKQLSVPFLGSIELDPEIRKGGDSGQPIVLEGDQSPHAKSMFAFTQKVIERTKEVQEVSWRQRDRDSIGFAYQESQMLVSLYFQNAVWAAVRVDKPLDLLSGICGCRDVPFCDGEPCA